MASMKKHKSIHGQTPRRPGHLPLPVWLGYLLAATLLFSTAGFARYTTEASGSVTARVAKFDVSARADQSDVSISLTPGDMSAIENTYSFTVTNDSEVMVEYSVIVSNVPAGVTVGLEADNVPVTSTSRTGSTDMRWQFEYQPLGMELFDYQNDCVLTFTADAGALAVNNQPITVQVNVRQVD